MKSFQTTQREERIEWTRDTADGVLQVREPLTQLLVAGHDDSADHVRMAVQKLSGGVDHGMKSMLHWPLEIGTGEGIIGDREPAALLCNLGDGLQVGHFQHRIRRRFHPNHACVRAGRAFESPWLGQVYERKVESR